MTKTATFIFLAFLLTSGLMAKTGSKCAELNKKWSEKYHAEFNVEWPLIENFKCRGNGKSYVMAKTIYELETMTYNSKKDKTAPDFYNWLVSIIKRTVYQSVHDKWEWASASSGGGTLWLHDSFFNHNLEWLTSTLIH